MQAHTIASRRQIITVFLLLLAVTGGLIRWLAPQPSLARDMGSLLLVLWLPIIGNIIAWLVARAAKPKVAAPGFAADAAFVPSARIALTLMAAAVPSESRPVPAGLFPCMVVVGTDAFSARLSVPADGVPVPEVAQVLEVEFLRPEVALPRLPADTTFTLLAGRTLLGQGRVLAMGS
ncbi:MAG: hypothetical protein JWP29_3422 [Rhodoferax sp.]|nr:hypothetical protein [Rhodoferax sp.]